MAIAWIGIPMVPNCLFQMQRYTYYRCAQIDRHEHPVWPSWVPESVIESQVISMLDKLILPKEIYDWAIAYLEHTLVKDAADSERELRKLKRGAADTLLLKDTQTEDNLAKEFFASGSAEAERISSAAAARRSNQSWQTGR
jgi:hypothetical protein